jgi:hypothetical protein
MASRPPRAFRTDIRAILSKPEGKLFSVALRRPGSSLALHAGVMEHTTSLWIAILVGFGIVAALIAIAHHGRIEGIYVGIVERGLAIGTDHESLQVRAYVDERLVHELPAPSKLVGRMLIRETNASVPLMFVRVPRYASPKLARSVERQEPLDEAVLPVIFRFDQVPELVVRAGQLVDVWIGKRSRVLDR